MNTVKKGNAFEDKVFSVLKELVESDQLAIDRRNYRIFQKKGYYSETRKREIIFDISIEVYMPGADEFSYLYLIECKDHTSPVSVNKISYFNSQVREVNAHKGFVFSTSKYQSSAVNTAKTNRMGLVIINADNNVDWIVRRSINNKRFTLSKSEDYFSGEGSIDTPFIGYDYPNVHGHIVDFLLANEIDVTSKGLCVPFIDDH
jgi:predicted helicase